MTPRASLLGHNGQLLLHSLDLNSSYHIPSVEARIFNLFFFLLYPLLSFFFSFLFFPYFYIPLASVHVHPQVSINTPRISGASELMVIIIVDYGCGLFSFYYYYYFNRQLLFLFFRGGGIQLFSVLSAGPFCLEWNENK